MIYRDLPQEKKTAGNRGHIPELPGDEFNRREAGSFVKKMMIRITVKSRSRVELRSGRGDDVTKQKKTIIFTKLTSSYRKPLKLNDCFTSYFGHLGLRNKLETTLTG